jgi:effector-binding domain-containing protein
MHEIESRTLDAQPTLVVRGKVATSEIKEFLGRAYHLVAARADECGAHFTGPPFARYRALDAEFTEFEVEAGFPVVVQVPCRGEVEPSELPGGTAAATVHIGPYDAMQPAYEAMLRWIEARGWQPDGPAWEVYLSDPASEPDPAQWRTEIIQPYRSRD